MLTMHSCHDNCTVSIVPKLLLLLAVLISKIVYRVTYPLMGIDRVFSSLTWATEPVGPLYL